MAHTITATNHWDIDRIRPLVDTAIAATITEFDDLGARAILTPSNLTFALLDRPPANFGWDYAQAFTTQHGAGRVELLAPSSHGSFAPDGFAPSFDRVWYHRNLIHECTSVFMWSFDGQKDQGWRLNSAPSWFVEGVQEYVAVERAAADARNRYRTRYFPRLREETVAADFGHVAEKYADGYLVLRFMYDDFGPTAVHKVLASPVLSFWGAVEASFGIDRKQLFGRWLKWRIANAP